LFLQGKTKKKKEDLTGGEEKWNCCEHPDAAMPPKKTKGAKAPPVKLNELEGGKEFIDHRIAVLERLQKAEDSLAAKKKAEAAAAGGADILVTLPDGKEVPGKKFETTPYDVALGISRGLADSCVVAKLDGETLWDMTRPLEASCKLELCKFDSPEGKEVFWHSSAHVLGEALERLYGCDLTRGPPQEDGFFYDIACPDGGTVGGDELDKITDVCRQIIKEKQPFERVPVNKEEALEMFKLNKYKVHYINEHVESESSIYRCGTLVDLCQGPHVPHTMKLKAFEVTKNSSSYWLGKAENDVLQRVYAISFPDVKQLKEWKHFQAEAKKRDHRELAKQQELFFFHPLSPGSAFMQPHGARIYNKLMDFMKSEYRKRGFTEVMTPNMYNSELWEKSGHWQHYAENMFQTEVEGHTHALKPMNCPGHCLMFDHRPRSHKELPMRYADFGVLHRNELAGALTGLTRVRRFQQDDAHIFCMPDQVGEEIMSCLEFMNYVYGAFGFEFSLELSTRPDKFLGEIAVWDKAEAMLESALNDFCAKVNGGGDDNSSAADAASDSKSEAEQKKVSWKLNPKDGAFYGPKIDIHITDALRRSHQCATVQLDFQLPDRFGLQFQDQNENLTRPVMIHRAILGSVERMMAILIEHTGGKWPLWLSPRQILVAPVSDKFCEYAEKVRQELHDAGYFADADLTDKKLPKKVREAQLAQYNFILVVGQKEVDSETVNVRTRDNKVHGERKLSVLIDELRVLEKEFK
jgi:threonyl-tRNA synthetase